MLFYLRQGSAKGDSCTVTVTNVSTQKPMVMAMVRENGDWKLDLPMNEP